MQMLSLPADGPGDAPEKECNMEKKFGKLMALILALVLMVPTLAQPALANQNAAIAEQTSVVKVYIYDSDGTQRALMNAFLVSDPASELTFLVGSSRIGQIVQQDYSIRLVRSNGSELNWERLAYNDWFTYLYAPDLKRDSKMVLSADPIAQADTLRAIYWTSRNGGAQVYEATLSMNKGWGKVTGSAGDGSRWVYSDHKVEDACMLSAPVVRESDRTVVGILEEIENEMVIIPLEQGVMPASCSLEKWGQETSKDDGSTVSQQPAPAASEEPETSEAPETAAGSLLKDNLTWIILGAAVLVVVFLVMKSRRKPAQKADEEVPAPAPVVPEPMPAPVGPITNVAPIQNDAALGKWQLRFVSGALEGRVFPLGSVTSIGRSSQNTVSFPADTAGVSSRHCVILQQDGRVLIKDLASSYGTYLNDNRLEANREYDLHPGDTVALAQNGPTLRLEAAGQEETGSGPALRDADGRIYRAGSDGRLTLGRDKSNLLCVPDQIISSSHCVLYRQGGAVYLMDVGSVNGTFLREDERLKPNTPYPVHKGTAFFLGNRSHTFVITEE